MFCNSTGETGTAAKPGAGEKMRQGFLCISSPDTQPAISIHLLTSSDRNKHRGPACKIASLRIPLPPTTQ